MSKRTVNKVPRIRFKEFEAEWEEKALGEITTYKNGKGHEDRQSSHGKYELINLNSISISGGLKHSGKFIDEAEETLKKDDLVMILSDVAHGNLLGRVALIPENDRFVLNQRVALLRPLATKSSIYLLYRINARQSYFKLRGAGMSQLNISKNVVTEFTLFTPTEDEQTQIGTYFQELDSLIGLHQRKHDKLVTLKKAMLQKMFPQPGAATPEIRFKGFSGDWEEKKLGEITIYKNGKGHEDQQSSRGKYELINLNSISISGGLKHSGKFIDEAEETLKKDDLVMILSDVAHGNLLGRVARIPENDRFVLNQRVALLRPLTSKSSTYLLYQINARQSYFKLRGAGMSQLNISKNVVTEFTLFTPNENEQQKIGTYFRKLDELISKHAIQLQKLQQIKLACLEKMFV